MNFVYPAVFKSNDDGTYLIYFPDIPGCITQGNDLADALFMAEDVLLQRLEYMSDEGEEFPEPTGIKEIESPDGAFVNLVRASIKEHRRTARGAVRRTVSLPEWMDKEAKAAKLSLSKILQDELKMRLL
jgi:predicted RNase H-like HicB family nuclease